MNTHIDITGLGAGKAKININVLQFGGLILPFHTYTVNCFLVCFVLLFFVLLKISSNWYLVNIVPGRYFQAISCPVLSISYDVSEFWKPQLCSGDDVQGRGSVLVSLSLRFCLPITFDTFSLEETEILKRKGKSNK